MSVGSHSIRNLDERGLSRRHLNIGTGRVFWQDVPAIKREFRKNSMIIEGFKGANDCNGRPHLLGRVRPDRKS